MGKSWSGIWCDSFNCNSFRLVKSLKFILMSTYQELLLSEEWHSFRKLIIDRDENKCLNCHNESYITNFEGSLAWVYPISNSDWADISIDKNKYVATTNLRESNPIAGQCYCYFKHGIGEYSIRIFVQAIRQPTQFDKNELLMVLFRSLFDSCKDQLSEEVLNTLFRDIYQVHGWDGSIPKQTSFSQFRWHLVKNLHVHHTYYQRGLYPWEYPLESLQTLCWDCHEKLHKNTKVPICDHDGNVIQGGFLTVCGRCHGAG